MVARHKRHVHVKEFVVISEEGYFAGIYNGGMFKWSFDINEAKPLTNPEQVNTIKKRYIDKPLIQEYL
jgi:hypothetical protein